MTVKINSTDPTTTVVTLDLNISTLLHRINRKSLLLKNKVMAHYQKAILENKAVLVKSDDETILELMSELGQMNNKINIQLVG